MARRLGWGVGALILLVMVAGADHPPPPGFALLVVVAVLAGIAVARLVPPLLRLWDHAGAVRALARAALVGFAGGTVVWALASTVQLVTGANSGGVGVQVLGFLLGSGAATISAVAVAAGSRLLDVYARRGPTV